MTQIRVTSRRFHSSSGPPVTQSDLSGKLLLSLLAILPVLFLIDHLAHSSQLNNTPVPTEWAAVGGDLSNQRYSTLSQINSNNVSRLKGAWTARLDVSGTSSPLVIAHGRIFTTAGAGVYALDATNGKTLWRYQPAAGPSSKGVAVGSGRVYVGLSDANLIALDEKTGRLLWTTLIGDANATPPALGNISSRFPRMSFGRGGEYIAAAPAFAAGRVVVGLSNGDFGIRGRVCGVDAATGHIQWTFYTVPGPGEAGHNTWPNQSDVWKNGGGGIWMPPAIDATLGLVYLGVGNPVPQWGGEVRAGDNLYTDSVIALDLKSGRLRWHYQLVHHDLWDHDLGTPLVLFDMTGNGQARHGLAVLRTDGYLFQLDRVTGQPLLPIEERRVPQSARLRTAPTQPFPVGAEPLAPLCVPATLAPRGFRLKCYFDTYDYDEPNTLFPFKTTRAAPMAYSPETHFFYATAAVAPTWLRRSEDPYYIQVQKTRGLKNYGLIAAIDQATGRIAWRQKVPHRIEAGSGALATAGNLVFHGEPAGQFEAYDARTGERLWSFQTGAGANGFAATYAIGNQQTVVIAAGTIWAFRLDGTLGPRPAPPPLPDETNFPGPIVATNTLTIGTNVSDMGLTGAHEFFDEYALKPARIRVAPQTAIQWVNHGKLSHTFIADDGSWTTARIAPGARASLSLTKPGRYRFTAQESPWVSGEIVVSESSSSAPAERGTALYHEKCALCHLDDMSGHEPAPELVGQGFLAKWSGHTAGDLFARVQATMPLGAPHSLTNTQYLDIVAHILEANEVPLTSSPELAVQQLGNIQIVAP